MRRGVGEDGLKLRKNAEQAGGPEVPEASKHGENVFRSARRRKDTEAGGEPDEEFPERGVMKTSSAVTQSLAEAAANAVDELLWTPASWQLLAGDSEETRPHNGTAQRAAHSGTSAKHKISAAATPARTDQRS